MPPDAVTRARLRAYQLMEQAQSESHLGVRERLVDLEASCADRKSAEAAQLAATGVVLYDLVHGEVEDAALDMAATLRSVRRGNGVLGRVRRLIVAGRS